MASLIGLFRPSTSKIDDIDHDPLAMNDFRLRVCMILLESRYVLSVYWLGRPGLKAQMGIHLGPQANQPGAARAKRQGVREAEQDGSTISGRLVGIRLRVAPIRGKIAYPFIPVTNGIVLTSR